MMDFSVRFDGKEIMDGPEKVPGSYEKAYRDISRCNAMLGGHKANLKEVKKLINRNIKESYTIWDLGSGDGSTLAYLAKHLKNGKKSYTFQGFDLSALSVEVARRNYAHDERLQFHQQDILKMSTENKPDIILCNLTLHHFTDEEAKILLKTLVERVELGVLINDLERHPWAYRLFQVFSLVFIRTQIAKTDGLISIRRAFHLQEFKQWALEIPQALHRIRKQPLFRLIWVLEPLKPSKN